MRRTILVSLVAAAGFGCGKVEQTPSDCTAPCAGDPVADFGMTQGGANGRWRYLADDRSPNGGSYVEMTWGDVDGAAGWVGAGDGAPGIISCDATPDAPGCANLETALLFVPGDDADPALAFVAASDGTYHLTGTVQAATGDPEGLPQTFFLSRNSRHDLLDSQVHVTAPSPDDFGVTAELLAGDELILTLVGADSAQPVTFDYHVTLVADGPDAFPGACQLAARFDEDDPYANPCRGSEIEDLNDGIGPPGTTGPEPSVNAQLGEARAFMEGQFLRAPGGPLDKTGDFTIQFWAKLTEPQEFGSTLYADWNSAVLGGVNLEMMETDGFYLGSIFGTEEGSTVTGTRPTDGEWHFYRIVRSVEEAQIELCIDGDLAVADPAVTTADMTSDMPPHIGRNVDYNPAYFDGSIDDVRGFKRALPCPTP